MKFAETGRRWAGRVLIALPLILLAGLWILSGIDRFGFAHRTSDFGFEFGLRPGVLVMGHAVYPMVGSGKIVFCPLSYYDKRLEESTRPPALKTLVGELHYHSISKYHRFLAIPFYLLAIIVSLGLFFLVRYL